MKRRFAVLFSLVFTLLLVGCGASEAVATDVVLSGSDTQIILEQSSCTDEVQMDSDESEVSDSNPDKETDSTESDVPVSTDTETTTQLNSTVSQSNSSQTNTNNHTQNNTSEDDEWVEIECVHADTSGEFYISAVTWTEKADGLYWSCSLCGVTARDGEEAHGTITVRKSSLTKNTETDTSPLDPSVCKHYNLINGYWTNALDHTAVDGDYDIFTCSRCGTVLRILQPKTPEEAIVDAVQNNRRPPQIDDDGMACAEVIRGIYNSLPENADNFDKILAAAQWLYDNCEYDHDNYIANTIPWISHTYKGPLLKGVAVCDGYAKAFKLIMDCFGVENKYCTGNTIPQNELHAWNRVKLDGNWYFVDTTWGDDNFLLSEEAFAKDHRLTTSDEGLATTPLPEKYLKRLYNVPDENVLSCEDNFVKIFHANVLSGKTNNNYLIKKGNTPINTDVWVFNDCTEEEKEIIQNYLFGVSGRVGMNHGDYWVVTLTQKSKG